jgi:hypothetical protein
MQLTLSFALLFNAIILVVALPVSLNRQVSLPLKRSPSASSLHPQILLQKRLNRSLKRYARMTGREQPSSVQLRENLQKRFNRHGVKKFQEDALASSGSDLNGPGVSPLDIAAIANPGVTDAGPPSDPTDSLGLDIDGADIGYLATIQMGTPPQDYLILMDSGSADLWVGSENCQSQQGGGCGNHTFLGPDSSSTFVDTNQPFSVTYGTGDVSGDIITDNIVVAGLALNAHTFGVATSESDDFSSDSIPFDGLMGLAKSALSQQNTLTPVESLAAAGLITAAITSYKIPRLADNLNDGEITFGGLDPTKFVANTLTTLDNVSPTGFWEANLDAVSVDGNDTGLQGRTAILDTGTTLIVAPPDDAATVHAAIPGAQSDGQGGFTVPCTTSASVALTFGGTVFPIDSRDIATAPVDPNDPTGDCVSGITSGEVGGATEWLVGDVFLKNAYFSTNVNTNQIQLAQLT